MDGLLPKQQTPVEEMWHNEQRRKTADIIRVSNPREATVKGKLYRLPAEDFYIEYDTNQFQKVPFGQTLDVPRPRAERFIKHMKNRIINYVAKKMHDDYIAERDRKGLPRYTDKFTENNETYSTQEYPKTDDPQLIAELYNQLWVGVVLIAGNDRPPEYNDPRSGEVDTTPIEVKAMEALNKKRVDVGELPVQQAPAPYVPQTPPPQPAVSPFASMNQQLSPQDIEA